MRLWQAVLELAWEPAALEQLWNGHQGRTVTTRDDQVIYAQRDPLDEVYLLTRGMVRLFVGDGDNTRTSLFLRAPALFGDRDILAGCDVSQESAQSVSTARLLSWPRAELDEAFVAHEAVRRRLTIDLVRRYARSIRFADYLALPLEQRLLWLLGELQESGAPLPIYETLARLTDSTPKSVGRAVRQLHDSGKLQLGAERGYTVAPAAFDELGAGEFLGLFHRFVLEA